nr:MAG TPA: hypothetical protein [Caudoviricetes sp.]
MDNPFQDIISRLNKLEKLKLNIRCGTVTSVSPFRCKFDGEDVEIQYLRPANYTPTLNDRVYFLCAGSSYICLGRYV